MSPFPDLLNFLIHKLLKTGKLSKINNDFSSRKEIAEKIDTALPGHKFIQIVLRVPFIEDTFEEKCLGSYGGVFFC